MDNNKRRKIYDRDATVVEVSEPKKKSSLKIELEDHAIIGDKKTVSVMDVLDSFAGYLPPKVNFINSGEGVCVLCGAPTASAMRKICYPCMEKNSKKLYNKAKKAIESGEKEFEF